MTDWLFVLISLIALVVFSYTDLKTREVPDKPVHYLIITALILNFLLRPLNSALNILLITIIITGFFFALYLFGQIGGGDVKLIALLSLLVPYYPLSFSLLTHSIPSSFPFIIPLFLLAGLIGPMLVIPCYYFYKLWSKRKMIKRLSGKIIKASVYSIVLLPLAFMWSQLNMLMGLLFIPIIFSLWMIVFKDDVMKLFCVEKKKVRDLNDDDVIALEFMEEKVKKKLGLWHKTLTSIELRKVKEKAKKERIREVPVLEHLPPFVPFLLVSFVLNLLFGDFMMLLLGGGF